MFWLKKSQIVRSNSKITRLDCDVKMETSNATGTMALSYKNFMAIVQNIRDEGKVVQDELPKLLEGKIPGIVLPSKLSNLTRKAEKFLATCERMTSDLQTESEKRNKKS